MAKEGKMRKEKETEVVILLIGIVLLMSTQLFTRSSAQVEEEDPKCWRRIINCTADNQSALEFQQNCCGTLLQEISTEKECFCSIQPLLQNKTIDAVVTNMLTLCSVAQPFRSLCSDTAPSPIGNRSLPPAPTPITTPVPSPIGPSISPNGAPFSSPSTEEEDDGCWDRIINCTRTSTTTATTFLECCPLIQEEIEYERECFCAIRIAIRGNDQAFQVLSQLFTVCSLPGTFDSVCPDTSSSPGGPLSSSPTGVPSADNKSIPTSPGSQTSSGETLIPPPPGTFKNNDENGSSKIIISVGLLLPQALLVVICTTMLS